MKSRRSSPGSHGEPGNIDLLHWSDPFVAIIDLPPRTRRVIIVAGLASLTMFAMANLISGGQQAYVQTDKIIHFVGYTMLAFLFVIGLKPRLCALAMVLLVFFGLLIEYIQLQSGRIFDLLDQLANMSGIVFGFLVGVISKFIFNYIKSEIDIAELRKNTLVLNSGEILFSEGDKSEQFYLIKSGRICLTSSMDGDVILLGEAGPGEIVGEMGVIERLPRSATAASSEDTVLYAMTAEKLLDADTYSDTDHPATIVIQVLANRLREKNELVKRLQARGESVEGQ